MLCLHRTFEHSKLYIYILCVLIYCVHITFFNRWWVKVQCECEKYGATVEPNYGANHGLQLEYVNAFNKNSRIRRDCMNALDVCTFSAQI